MIEEKTQTFQQRENGKQKLLQKLVANARNIIINEVGIPVGVEKMTRYITWLEQVGIHLNFPIFEQYMDSIVAIPSGKERLNCSREALRRYDDNLNQINLNFHDQIIDACFEIL
jgi:hypothetical protein